ncbi:hypothetical protein GCM10009798_00510 [Nocardioides panacihumi]|uniref:Endonuclease/exonuclease/phosphatase family protein n=1 Tax=Nocardioides panacihumi TaxID=400774 RepID=A0ABN2Q661_9ACTN
MKGHRVTSPGRRLLTATLLAALLLVARPAGAELSDARPAAGQTADMAVTPTRLSASGTAFWANVGVEHLAHAGSAARQARLVLGVMRSAHASIGLLAESNGRQVRALRRASHGGLGVVPGRQTGETNAVVYDAHVYRLERVVRLRSFGYRGRPVPVAVAVLRDRASGVRIGALAVHHPASNTRRGAQGRWQQASWRRELGALGRLRSAYGGRISTFLGGDFNQRATCRLVARTGMVSPVGTVASCPTARTRIDQLFADPSVTFSDYRMIRGGAARRATDHAGMYATGFELSQPA